MQLPAGFRFSGVSCGIKASRKPDVALIVGDPGTVAAGVYTQNQVVAAPVVVSRKRAPGEIRAVVVNSGNANACTGEEGLRDAQRMTELVASCLNCSSSEVLVMSTGIIGHKLPMEKVESGILNASKFLDGGEVAFHSAADAILTTDQSRKIALRNVRMANGYSYRIAGMAKGAGMIGPNMATMLGVVMTDFPLTAQQADQNLRRFANTSFNCIRVEGHTSTNDSLVLMSSGKVPLNRIDDGEYENFLVELESVFTELAKLIPADGEGATHLIEVCVTGAANDDDAKTIAKTIADSPLVKTAITGNDPNWGRIVSAAGYAAAPIDPAKTSLKIQGIPVYENGTPLSFDAATVSAAMRDHFEVRLEITVGQGSGKTTIWSSDLTVAYVEFNSDYST